MRIELILDESRLMELAPQWSQLPCPSPMQQPDWLCDWWKAFGALSSQQRLSTLAVFDGTELVGLAPWYVELHSIVGDTIRKLGDGEVCSDHATILTQPNYMAVSYTHLTLPTNYSV